MFTLRKETKFNYGLLLFGAAMPPIIDAVFGHEWGLAALVLIACGGLALLISGHFHKEKGETETRLKRNGRFALFGSVLALAIIGVPWAIRKTQQTESPAAEKSPDKDLCGYAIKEAGKIREFQASYDSARRSIEDRYFSEMLKAANTDEKNAIGSRQIQEEHQLFIAHDLQFKNEFIGTAKYIKDSILDRLPANKRAGVLVNNSQAEMSLNLGQGAGAFTEDKIATYLDVLSKTLCKDDH